VEEKRGQKEIRKKILRYGQNNMKNTKKREKEREGHFKGIQKEKK
jgi:hypothetical protein